MKFLAMILLLVISSLAFAESDGKALVEKFCTQCHSTERIYAKKRDADTWGKLVPRMVEKMESRGKMVPSADERKQIISYLAKQ